MTESLNERLQRIGDEAEAGEADQSDRPLPPHVKVSMPNRARSRVLQVRLNDNEIAAIERIAAKRNLPASTLARDRLLRMIAEEKADKSDVAAQLNAAADQLRELAGLVADKVEPA